MPQNQASIAKISQGLDEGNRRLSDLMQLADPRNSAELQEAARAARDAVELAQQIGRDVEAQTGRIWLARHLYHLGQHAEALSYARTATQEDSALPPGYRVEGLSVVSLCACELSQFDVAIDAAQNMARVAAELNDATSLLRAAFNLAACFDRMGDSWQAERLLTRSLALHGEAASHGVQLMAWNALSAICADLAYQLHGLNQKVECEAVVERGKSASEKAIAIAQHTMHSVAMIAVQANLGSLLITGGEAQQALKIMGEARAAAAGKGLTVLECYLDVLCSEALMETGDVAAAADLIGSCLDKRTGEMADATRARAHRIAARCAKRTLDFQRAVFHFEACEYLEKTLVARKLRLQSELLVTRAEELQARREAELYRLRTVRLSEEAERDPLTGAGNRRFLDRWFTEMAPRWEASGAAVALVMIDIDHFKSVNDIHGHAAGDAVLVALARRISAQIRQGDAFARLGGEEFVIVLPHTPHANALQFCERLREQVESLRIDLPVGGHLSITISQGIAFSPTYELPDLTQRADAAMYLAKRAGRNRVCTDAEPPLATPEENAPQAHWR